MGVVFRPLFVITLVVGGGAAYWLQGHGGPATRAATVSSASASDGDRLIVWSGERHVGQTWAKLGPKGSMSVTKDTGMDGKGGALTIRLDGEGYHGCGLNWKGWHPDDACDDVSTYKSLVFYVRKGFGPEGSDLTVKLVDNVKRSEGTDPSNALHIVADGGVPKIDGEWRKVVLPLERFAKNKPLKLDRLWGIDFGHYGNKAITFYIDRIGFGMDRPPPPRFKSGGVPYPAAARLTSVLGTHAIRDDIYGVCGLPADKLSELGIPVTRWGGNTSSRFNWRINADNGAADWYFKNRGKPIGDPSENGWIKHIRDNQERAATSYLTVPMLGWVAKDHDSYGFSVKKYGKQKSTENGSEDIGDGWLPTRDQPARGEKPRDKPVTGNSPEDTSVPAPPAFVAEGVRLVVAHLGRAERGGVRYWVLDNEPMLWHSTHRDVRPAPLGADELWQRTVAYAEAVRREDPTAKIAGFCSWGWLDLFYSALDETDRSGRPDYRAHGSVPLAVWFMQKCAEYKKRTGRPLVDVFDLHWYPQARARDKRPYEDKGMEIDLNELRLRTVRELWDPAYYSEAWIREVGDRRPPAVIRRVREWIERYNPGMELCVGEYNFGGTDNITGGLAQADVLGVFARERVDLAFLWHTPEGTQNLAWQLFRDYDGRGGRFGDRYLPIESNNPDLAVYAARRSRDRATTIVAINKKLMSECELTLNLSGLTGRLRVYRFDQTTGDNIIEVPSQAADVKGNVILTLPAASASMVVIE